jgi:hypothetical protein
MARIPLNPVRLSVAVYRALLIAYPPSHRQVYGSLMVQLFRDLCRDAYEQSGIWGLMQLWMRILVDLVVSASAAYLQAAKEVVMTINHRITPMSWHKVMLVVVPGILFGISRIYFPLWWPAVVSFVLVAILAFAALATQKHLPAWGLLVLGLLTNWVLLWIGFQVMEELATRMRVGHSIRHLFVAIPLWVVIIVLAWKYEHAWPVPSWALALFALSVVGVSALVGYGVLSTVGLMLLPVALGLPLSQRHGSLASLFVVGAYSLWLFDSDFISGHLLRDMTFYPVYAILLAWLFISVAPLLLLRARSRRGQVAGLLSPIVVVLIARTAVPWLARPDFSPLRIWLSDMLLSVFTLLILVLALVLYTQTDGPETPADTTRTNQPVYTS